MLHLQFARFPDILSVIYDCFDNWKKKEYSGFMKTSTNSFVILDIVLSLLEVIMGFQGFFELFKDSPRKCLCFSEKISGVQKRLDDFWFSSLH